jgi:hypothetical protein
VRTLPNLKRLTTGFVDAFVDPSQPNLRQLETFGLYFEDGEKLPTETFEKIVRKHCIPSIAGRDDVHDANTILKLFIPLNFEIGNPEWRGSELLSAAIEEISESEPELSDEKYRVHTFSWN